MENEIFKEDNMAKAYLRLSMPLVFSMVISLIYNLADTFFIAQTKDTNIVAGVALGAPVFTALMAVGNIFGQGGSSLISRLLGKKDTAGARRASAFCFYGALLSGIVIGAAMLALRTPLLYIMGANEETFSHASDYFIYLAIGAPVIILSFIHSNLLRAEGMSKESMIGTILGALVNIVLDPIFISVLGWQARGAAIATVAGYACSDIFFAIIVLIRSRILSIHPREIKIPGKFIRQILGIGIPAAIVNLMQSISTILVNQFLLPYGNDQIAAMGIVTKVNLVVLLLITGFAFGGQPLFGYYYGSGDKARLFRLFRFCLKFISTIAIVLTAVVFFTAPVLIRCFMNNENIIQTGTVMLRWQVITTVCAGIILLITILCQAFGKVIGSFILSVSRQGVIFLAVLIIGCHAAGYTGIITAQAIADVISALIAAIIFYKLLYKEMSDRSASYSSQSEQS